VEKTKINLDIILPEVPDERDVCVSRVIKSIESKRGIDAIHIVPSKENKKARLCFHYDPSSISIDEIEELAKESGAEITQLYGHLLIQVSGIRQARHARILEADINDLPGVLNASVSGTGFIQLEYEKSKTNEQGIKDAINRFGLQIIKVDNFRPLQSREGECNHEHPNDQMQHKDQCKEEKHEHQHTKGKEIHSASGCDHTHTGIFGERTELIFSLICGSFLIAGFGLSFINGISFIIPIGFYIAAYFFGGFYTTKEAIEGISKGQFEIDFLMLVAAVGAAILGHWAEGALLLFLFSLGHSLEHYALQKARKSIAALTELTPKTALLKTGGGFKEVRIEELKPGDIIIVKPNSTIAADGIVINGSSNVNQAPITGESIPVDKIAFENYEIQNIKDADKLDEKYRVFAGSINGSQALDIKVSKLSANSTLARLIQLVNEAQTQKSPTQNFTDKIEKYYVPGVLILVGLLLFAFLILDESFGKSFYRAMAVLVAASPCALAIATPSAVLSGIARAARGGVLIKGGGPLEKLSSVNVIAFDKTGTLTEGKPKLTGVHPLNGMNEEQFLSIIVAVEKLSDHPLAKAIVKGGMERLKYDVPPANNVQAITGRGIKVNFENSVIHIGNKELFTEKNNQLPDEVKDKIEAFETEGNTTMLVQQDEKFIGVITLMDTPRKDAKETLARLHQLGIKKMIMLTGDNQKVAEAIAEKTGITQALGGLMPEQKVTAIERLQANEGHVAMIGDGVNDAPAMVKSSVSIAMGAASSEVALETADIALMTDKLNNLPFAIGLSKKAGRIIKQNLIISLGMVIILIPLTLTGYATIGPAVVGHEGSTLIVVFNALRLLAYKVRV
jgi:Cd2+/Zn2+-exporting ATPase